MWHVRWTSYLVCWYLPEHSASENPAVFESQMGLVQCGSLASGWRPWELCWCFSKVGGFKDFVGENLNLPPNQVKVANNSFWVFLTKLIKIYPPPRMPVANICFFWDSLLMQYFWWWGLDPSGNSDLCWKCLRKINRPMELGCGCGCGCGCSCCCLSYPLNQNL